MGIKIIKKKKLSLVIKIIAHSALVEIIVINLKVSLNIIIIKP